MIKYFCDRCGTEVPYDDTKESYDETPYNVKLEIYARGESPFIQGLEGYNRDKQYIYCKRCVKDLSEFLNANIER